MQTIKIFSALIAFLFMSCEKNEIDSVNELTDGFCIVVNEKVVLNHTAIDYYDF